MLPSSKSAPIPVHRSASHTPSMLVNAKKYLSDRPQLLDCPTCKNHGETELHFVNGIFTYVAFFVILIAGIFILPLFFLWLTVDRNNHVIRCHFVWKHSRMSNTTVLLVTLGSEPTDVSEKALNAIITELSVTEGA
ncbi:hypothetical protein DICVIV_00852 [Dictyocaulus viviparus]|uniref:LITAF domain-containing protein n=1 Tax=Dictyocaulus viviparus TaxID=29172 RepID=A0A0D8Y800_DICVI|nr:hypothetical protein DICVIV_00852 [Dictyocaulus viviparus]